MKIISYETRGYEKEYFEELAEKLNIVLVYTEQELNLETIQLAKGCDAVTVLNYSQVNAEILDQLKAMHISCLSARSTGYNHIDVVYAKKIGFKIAHAQYDSSSVAEFTVMMLLMAIRKVKHALCRGNVNDYSLEGLQGKVVKNLTVGVIGSGKIGTSVIKYLHSFGCRLMVFDAFQNETAKKLAQYVDLDTLFRESDIITLHVPLLPETHHMVQKATLAKMKDGVVIINCARGELLDVEDLIEGIETGKIGALGLDVIEREDGLYHHDRRTDILKNQQMAYLRQFPNVVMTQHMAFFTDDAARSMVYCGVKSLVSFIQAGKSEYEV